MQKIGEKRMEAEMFDYLIVGAGLYGATCARELTDMGKSVLVIDKRKHIGGNVYTEKIEGINVHKYGAHIFHTKNKKIWDFANQLVCFNYGQTQRVFVSCHTMKHVVEVSQN